MATGALRIPAIQSMRYSLISSIDSIRVFGSATVLAGDAPLGGCEADPSRDRITVLRSAQSNLSSPFATAKRIESDIERLKNRICLHIWSGSDHLDASWVNTSSRDATSEGYDTSEIVDIIGDS